jgi:hypothetical protein
VKEDNTGKSSRQDVLHGDGDGQQLNLGFVPLALFCINSAARLGPAVIIFFAFL